MQRLDLGQLFGGNTGAFHGRHGHPRLDAAAAPGIHDDAHRHAKTARQLLREQIRHGRCICILLTVSKLPNIRNIFQFHMHRIGSHIQHADARSIFLRLHQVRPESFHFLEAEAAHRHLHVRLPAADPDFPEHHVGYRQVFLAGANGDRIRAAGRAGGQRHPPSAVVGHPGLDGGAVPGTLDRDGLARFPPAPHGSGGLLLKDHVVGERMGQLKRLRLQEGHGQQQRHCARCHSERSEESHSVFLSIN